MSETSCSHAILAQNQRNQLSSKHPPKADKNRFPACNFRFACQISFDIEGLAAKFEPDFPIKSSNIFKKA
jgi:hypothetical protein